MHHVLRARFKIVVGWYKIIFYQIKIIIFYCKLLCRWFNWHRRCIPKSKFERVVLKLLKCIGIQRIKFLTKWFYKSILNIIYYVHIIVVFGLLGAILT